jgi:hypothetical protein
MLSFVVFAGRPPDSATAWGSRPSGSFLSQVGLAIVT